MFAISLIVVTSKVEKPQERLILDRSNSYKHELELQAWDLDLNPDSPVMLGKS